MIKDIFTKYKKQIIFEFTRFFSKKRKEMKAINPWGEDVLKRLIPFLEKGKMIRGNLVVMTYEAFKNKIPREVIQAGLAIELVHTSLLIHDDIMDSDFLRRGEKTIFYQYKLLGERERFSHPVHFGEAMGICVGDIAFFLAYEILSQIQINPLAKQRLLSLFSSELIKVGLAQMQDVYFSITKKQVKERDVLSLYQHKTARYTFSLPMMMGALLANQSKSMIDPLAKIGEYIGIIFQIKDDELGLMGMETEIGKPVGSDIKEEKKTLYYLNLLKRVTSEQKSKLKNIFGNKNITKANMDYVHNLINKSGVKIKIDGMINILYQNALKEINRLKISKHFRNALLELLYYNLERKK